jgi:hypothetical protein
MSTGAQQKNPFVRRKRVDGVRVVGTRWWNESLERGSAAAATSRRNALIALGVGGGVVSLIAIPSLCTSDDDGVESSMDSLELQRKLGWDVGGEQRSLALAGRAVGDVEGGWTWRPILDANKLAERLRPSEGRLLPYYDPTLFQAPEQPSAQILRAALAPVHTSSMDDAYLRGRALGTLFEAADHPRDTAVVIDLPGADAVAAAAALADHFAPVFMFDNWPHPMGVVPSQQTIGAALYYLPVFERMNQTRVPPAPPAFVLDANRLLPYRDAASEFDNRYAVSLPSLSSLKGLGIKQILYLRADDASLLESDDLNEDLSQLEASGMQVRALAMTDFQPEGAGTANVPDAGASASATASSRSRHYYYGGSPGTHFIFWSSYGWYRPAPVRGVAPPARPFVSRGAAYRPTPRPTIFASRAFGGTPGVGKQKPSGFGRVSVRTSTSTGSVTRVGSGRSGSFGRSFSSSSG